MSQFTSNKVSINDSENLSTLLAEYSGEYEIKIWILDRSSASSPDKIIAWTGELSSTEARGFISRYKLVEEVFLKELQKALTSSDPEVLYFIEKTESDGYRFSWKRPLHTGLAIKYGEIILEKVSLSGASEEVLDRCFEHNFHLQSQVSSLKSERDVLLKEKNEVLLAFEKTVQQKKIFEETVYSQFLAVLNSKKDKIDELQKELDRYVQSKESSPKPATSPERRKRRSTQTEAVVAKKTAKQREKEEDSESTEEQVAAEGEVDPYDVDTDIDDDAKDGDDSDSNDRKCKSNARPNLRSLSNSELFDSFEEAPSPVAILPKRSKLKDPKGAAKVSLLSAYKAVGEPSTNVDFGEDLIDEL